MSDIITLVFLPIILGLIVGIILIILEKTNWKNLFIKTKIIRILKKYDEIKTDAQKEKKFVKKLGYLLDKGREKIQLLGFSYKGANSINDNNFGIHLTRRGGDKGVVHQFLVRRLTNGQTMNPDQRYF